MTNRSRTVISTVRVHPDTPSEMNRCPSRAVGPP
ncbi:hypothetical protein Ae406Ps2_0409c [Pseudonocardia sp. Ae406_Ps2]|nr:hypothetical protein Ae406Ps2_0409c [Pseudonocardia sp. Ae406_Ps2]OLM07798.1 hypothetical protein Ae331Ps2_5508 [Pseudonocardia sp. Ae331_Ps2]OLM13955.1 hypothetical protein Ae505Ps2_4084c [Pseudonocardia sp. Ae505_Ps2]OLM21983.1 hypothetical protein Ae706Ps2_0415c [Pseudonocardia sp. Ae706_Ps2]